MNIFSILTSQHNNFYNAIKNSYRNLKTYLFSKGFINLNLED